MKKLLESILKMRKEWLMNTRKQIIWCKRMIKKHEKQEQKEIKWLKEAQNNLDEFNRNGRVSD